MRTIIASDIDSDDVLFFVDTALSWDGSFPPIGTGDYLVTLHAPEMEEGSIVVSRRYTEATDAEDAIGIAFDAFVERYGSAENDVHLVSCHPIVSPMSVSDLRDTDDPEILSDLRDASSPGDCEGAVRHLIRRWHVVGPFPEDLTALRETGAWSDIGDDAETDLIRAVWCMACDRREDGTL